jgi:hypothetical protein
MIYHSERSEESFYNKIQKQVQHDTYVSIKTPILIAT